ncbi:hypothetical protein F4805DRAFT_457735 [Annulohypoxylon moriforme]|nr:hypothetical protein F4805DRAFT_457735 [Annulohypoxylon moriforme]
MTTHVSPSHLSGVTDILTPTLTPNALPQCSPNARCRYAQHTQPTPFVTHRNLHIPSFRNLSPRARIGVGLGLLAWGAVGLHLSDRAEERYGLTPTEEDKAALDKVFPRITAVDKDEGIDDASPISKSSSSSSSGNNGN